MRRGSSTSASRRGSRAGLAGALVAALAAGAAPAQPEDGDAPVPALPVVTLDQDALFLQSQYGQRVQRDLERDRAALAAENRRIEADLIAEERALTERRAEMPAAEFAPLAEAFDEKVQRIRAEQEMKARGLQEKLERERQRFLDEITTVLTDMLRARGAAVVLDSDAVLFAVEGIDITQAAIDAIDAAIGDGTGDGLAVPPAPPADAGAGGREGAPGADDR